MKFTEDHEWLRVEGDYVVVDKSEGVLKVYKGDAPAGAWIIGFDRFLLCHFKEHSNRRRNIVAIPTLEGCVHISKHQADLWQSFNPRPDVAVMAILEIRLGGYRCLKIF